MTDHKEVLISVDVETSGPIPGEYSMLSIGACLVSDPAQTFACELKPTSGNAVPEALAVSGLSLEELARTGLDPVDAMSSFAAWVGSVAGTGEPVFVGFNAPFDWSFVNYYFHRYTGSNPFGFAALDIKALWMGITGCSWADTRSSSIASAVESRLVGDHDALHDALYQADLLRLMLAMRSDGGPSLSTSDPSR